SGDPVSIAADGNTVYASAGSLYVTNDQRWRYRGLPVPGPVAAPNLPAGPAGPGGPGPAADGTEIYQFDISGAARPRFVASGSVPGWLLNQYALSEFGGHLRVASSTAQPERGPQGAQTRVSVLTRHGARLAVTGAVGGLGRGEQVYAVRFAGPVGYVVT